ncbi:RHS Repeat protein [compost metagenome]
MTLRHPHSQRLQRWGVFRGQGLTDQTGWLTALANFIRDQAWPELRLWGIDAQGHPDMQASEAANSVLWLARNAELQLALVNVGEVEAWEQPGTRHLIDVQTGCVLELGEQGGIALPGRFAWEQAARVEDLPKKQESEVYTIPDNPKGEWVFRLSAAAVEKGYRVAASLSVSEPCALKTSCYVTRDSITWLSGRPGAYRFGFDCPAGACDGKDLIVGHIGHMSEQGIWTNVQAVVHTAPVPTPAYQATSPLCEDYGSTMRSSVFDVEGHSETGVDPRTGLFHAHYPVATVQGLGGNGPVCDLTLHYSALRGNEAGLGDGWAWRFSSLDTRDRCLTLSDGGTVSFTDSEWEGLGKGTPVRKSACWVRSNKDYSEFIIDLPSGRQEVLSKPSAPGGNETEHNDALRLKLIEILQAIRDKKKPQFPAKPTGLVDWLLVLLCPPAYYGTALADYNDAVEAWKEHIAELDKEIAYWQRPFIQLLPSRIVSPFGEALTLVWQRKDSQFLLQSIESGATTLFSASYENDGVEMSVWKDSQAEAFNVSLKLSNYLLSTLTLTQGAAPESRVLQHVTYGYSPDPTLDYILSRIEEEDGSVERVEYEAERIGFPDGRPALPCVKQHVLIPGGNQENCVTAYVYSFANGHSVTEQVSEYPYPRLRKVQRSSTSDYSHPYKLTPLNCRIYSVSTIRYVQGERVVCSKLFDDRKFKFSELNCVGDELGLKVDCLSNCNEVWASLELSGGANFHALMKRLLCYIQIHYLDEQEYKIKGSFCQVYPDFRSLFAEGKVWGDKLISVRSLSVMYGGAGSLINIHQSHYDNFLVLLINGFTAKGAGAADVWRTRDEATFYLSVVSLFEAILNLPVWSGALAAINVSDGALPDLSVQCSGYSAQHVDFSRAVDGTFTRYVRYPRNGGVNVVARTFGQVVTQLPSLSCPQVPEASDLPVMAEYTYSPSGQALGLKLYGYQESRSARPILQASDIVTIEGVTASDVTLVDGTTWQLEPGRTHALVRHQQQSTSPRQAKTGSPDCKAFVWSSTSTQTTRWGDVQTTLSNVQSFEDNPNLPGILVRTSCRSEAGEQEEVKEVRSRHSRLCLTKVSQGRETRWTYDGRGRITSQHEYPVTAGDSWADPKATPSKFSHTQYLQDGDCTVALITHKDKSQTRRYYDGLQRVWRTERLLAGQTGACLLDVGYFGVPCEADTEQEQTAMQWDYLPGGQALLRCEGELGIELPEATAWAEETLKEFPTFDGPEEFDSLKEDLIQLSVQRGWKVLLSKKKQATGLVGTQLKFTHNECVLQVDFLEDSHGTRRSTVARQHDREGRLVKLSRLLDGQLSCSTFDYDDLGRQIKVTRPDGSTVERRYHGLSSLVTELKVGATVVARQTATAPAKLAQRTVGTRTYGYGQDEAVTLSDQTQLGVTYDQTALHVKAGDEFLTTLTQEDSITTLSNGGTLDGKAPFTSGLWQHKVGKTTLPGFEPCDEITPRRTTRTQRWRTLRGHTVASLGSDGLWQRGFQGHDQRPLRHCQNNADILYRYNDAGLLCERRVSAPRSGGLWQVQQDYDVFGQETQRRFLCDGLPVYQLQMAWTGDGKLREKQSRQGVRLLRSETFAYDDLDRLKRYDCSAALSEDHPQDPAGKAVKAQAFTWDALNNMTQCVSEYAGDGGKRTQDFSYASDNPTRLDKVSTDGTEAVLGWNTNGAMTLDEQGRTLSYNAGGLLIKVGVADGAQTDYAYDGYQRLAAQRVDGGTRELRYSGDTLIGEDHFDSAGKLKKRLSFPQGLLQDDGDEVRWLVSDPQQGTTGQVKAGVLTLAPLLPFGEGQALDGVCLGYNGQRRDPVTGNYHPGNGYRCYSPTLYRHTQPDTFSPFDAGGINDYVFCPDPVNLHDPSGAIMVSRWGANKMVADLEQTLRDAQPMPVGRKWRGLALSAVITVWGTGLSLMSGGALTPMFALLTTLAVTALALEITATVLAESDTQLSKDLGLAAMITGFLSIGDFTNVFKQGARLLRWGASKVGQLAARMQAMVRHGARGFSNLKRYGHVGGRLQRLVMRDLGALSSPGVARVPQMDGSVRILTGARARLDWLKMKAVKVMPKGADVVDAISTGFEVKTYRDTGEGLLLMAGDAQAQDGDDSTVNYSRYRYLLWGGEPRAASQDTLPSLA